MKIRPIQSFLFVCFAVIVLAGACQKAPELTLSSASEVSLTADGSSGSITFTANRDWAASAADTWVRVSPASGAASKDPVTVTVRCDANTTYEDRRSTVTIRAEGLSQTVTVKQPANLGIIVPNQSITLAAGDKSFEVEVQANVQYDVVISADWIKQKGTKGLITNNLSFSVEENQTYDERKATVTISQQDGSISQTISVKQAAKEGLELEKKEYDMPVEGGTLEVKVKSNVTFEVTPSVGWIHYVETKALDANTVVLSVDASNIYETRTGKVSIKQKNGSLSAEAIIRQAGLIPVASVTLDKTELTLEKGWEYTLSATVLPENAADKTVTWSTSDAGIATVDANGKVVAVKGGSATITAKAGEKTATCKVAVYVSVEGVSLNKTELTLEIGQSETLVATVKPDDATDKTVTWSSSDQTVATVDGNGLVTAIKTGYAVVYAKSGDEQAMCSVQVKKQGFSDNTEGFGDGGTEQW